jgi:hypothetical protein
MELKDNRQAHIRPLACVKSIINTKKVYEKHANSSKTIKELDSLNRTITSNLI